MKILVFSGILLWLTLSVSGGFYLVWYKNQAASDSPAYPSKFPAGSSIKPNPEQSTLIFFAHPKCPCTQASLHELERLLADVGGKLTVYFVIIKPPGAPVNWVDTSLKTGAEAMPNVTVLIDENEREADLFKATTSGLNLLYDRAGNLKFDGGITSSRGHEGANSGRQTIYDLVTTDSSNLSKTPVFGCPLRSKDCDAEHTEDAR